MNIVPSNSINEYYWTTVDSKFLENCSVKQNCMKLNIKECYENEVCDNKKKSDYLIKLKTEHTSSSGRYTDSNDAHIKLFFTTMNLGLGIIFVSTLIIQNSK